MSLLMTLVIGGIVGWLASILMRTDSRMGIPANVIVGIIGSFLGTSLATTLGLRVHGTGEHLLVAIGGAALLIALLRGLGAFGPRRAWR